jgi:putative ubiquitin-RnfH superfamily antitoxin RatB of RatAB toxin-antitoxin module
MSSTQHAVAPITVEVMAGTEPRTLLVATLALSPGTTVEAALTTLATQPSWASACAAALDSQWRLALWSRKVGLSEVLRDGDRLELCRPLLVDPMVARRERFVSQGARSSGLFSKRRAGAKAGY